MAPQAELRQEFRASPGCDVAGFNSRRSDRGGTAAVREGGAAAGLTDHGSRRFRSSLFAVQFRKSGQKRKADDIGIAKLLPVLQKI
ncbi:unnamed protein product, partial [Vitis vinifera]